jgi:Zn-dependent protease with chaperone function
MTRWNNHLKTIVLLGVLSALLIGIGNLVAPGSLPRIFLIDDPQPNAFATGHNPAHDVVAVTTGILQPLPPRELRGVLTHELAHATTAVPSLAAQPAAASLFIVNPFTGGERVARLFSTHSATAERIAWLEALAKGGQGR